MPQPQTDLSVNNLLHAYVTTACRFTAAVGELISEMDAEGKYTDVGNEIKRLVKEHTNDENIKAIIMLPVKVIADLARTIVAYDLAHGASSGRKIAIDASLGVLPLEAQQEMLRRAKEIITTKKADEEKLLDSAYITALLASVATASIESAQLLVEERSKTGSPLPIPQPITLLTLIEQSPLPVARMITSKLNESLLSLALQFQAGVDEAAGLRESITRDLSDVSSLIIDKLKAFN